MAALDLASRDPLLRSLLVAWVLVAGAAIGSFLNVVIARVPEGQSILRPRSRCPGCATPIAWWDNLPVVSWVLLRGRCRACGAAISPRYLVVELLGAAAAYLAWRRHGLSAAAAVELAFVAFLIALAFIDLARWELPHLLTRPLLVLGLAGSAVSLTPAAGLRASALGAAAGFAAFWAVRKVGALLSKREAMGEGDVWLLSALGAWLGVAALLPVVMLASVQGSVVGLALLAIGKLPAGRRAGETAAPGAGADGAADDEDWVPPRNSVPFGPFLVVAALEWLYLAPAIVRVVPTLDLFL